MKTHRRIGFLSTTSQTGHTWSGAPKEMEIVMGVRGLFLERVQRMASVFRHRVTKLGRVTRSLPGFGCFPGRHKLRRAEGHHNKREVSGRKVIEVKGSRQGSRVVRGCLASWAACWWVQVLARFLEQLSASVKIILTFLPIFDQFFVYWVIF